MNKNIIVDCDLTVCDAIIDKWIDWLQEMTGVEKDPSAIENYGAVDYNLVKYWDNELKQEGIDGMDFWRQKYIYDGLPCVPWCQGVLEGLHERGYGVVVATQIKGAHFSSKYQWIKKNFPYIKGVLATKEKFLVTGSVLIDDRNHHLLSMPEHCKLIRRKTNYTQDCEMDRPFLDYNWTMGLEKLLEFIEEG